MQADDAPKAPRKMDSIDMDDGSTPAFRAYPSTLPQSSPHSASGVREWERLLCSNACDCSRTSWLACCCPCISLAQVSFRLGYPYWKALAFFMSMMVLRLGCDALAIFQNRYPAGKTGTYYQYYATYFFRKNLYMCLDVCDANDRFPYDGNTFRGAKPSPMDAVTIPVSVWLTLWTSVWYYVGYVFIALYVYGVFRLRREVQQVLKVQVDKSTQRAIGPDWLDLCQAFWCGCCVTTQMAREMTNAKVFVTRNNSMLSVIPAYP